MGYSIGSRVFGLFVGDCFVFVLIFDFFVSGGILFGI